jgi:hypothetical protein
MVRVVKQLDAEDFEISERDRTISPTRSARSRNAAGYRCGRPSGDIAPEQARLLGFLEQGLRAEYLFKRNKDYVVQGGRVIIVDEFTGRMMAGRRWSDGLHQAVEAKEGVRVREENVTYATITLQNYFRMYDKLAGMTGTAETEEFSKMLGDVPTATNLEYIGTVRFPLLVVEYRDGAAPVLNLAGRRRTAGGVLAPQEHPMVYRTESQPGGEPGTLRRQVQGSRCWLVRPRGARNLQPSRAELRAPGHDQLRDLTWRPTDCRTTAWVDEVQELYTRWKINLSSLRSFARDLSHPESQQAGELIAADLLDDARSARPAVGVAGRHPAQRVNARSMPEPNASAGGGR